MKSIRSIITEEIASLNNSDNQFQFSQIILNSYFSNYNNLYRSNDFEYDITESQINISWRVVFDLKTDGINSFNIRIDNSDIKGYYVLEQIDKHTDASTMINKNINEINWNITYSDIVLNNGGALRINSLEFDIDSNTCKINFY